jgi:hypothetical protein
MLISISHVNTNQITTTETPQYWTFPSIMILRDPNSAEGDFLSPNWIQCLYVFSFMLITIYLILNLGLAIVCDVVSSILAGSIRHMMHHGQRHLSPC